MDTFFLKVLDMSITASYVILIVLAARLLLSRVPKIFSYALWSVVLFRLISPFSFDSIFSLVPVSTQSLPTNIMYSQIPIINSGTTLMDEVAISPMMLAPEVSLSTNPMQTWITFGEAIWILGVAVLLIYSCITAINLCFSLKTGKLIFNNVYEMNGIKTPFIFGILQPKIYLPIGLSDKEKNYIIKHEETHIRRFDHIIKPVAFLVLSFHWFNPLVWIAFFFMSEDMEMSCDESVIKQMGSDIKKDYSTSLLSLSTGRRIIGGSPLAFGENNTKGRIINILNYKKPGFWAVIITVIAVVSISVGLISDRPEKQLTVEAYANQFVEQKIEDYSAYNFVDSKITKLEKIASFDKLLSSTVEIWGLEYRLKPDNISNVLLAGGMNEIDGWITEDESMGKPMLVFSYEGSKLQYLGYMKSGEADFSNLAGKEMALRTFLEGKGLLPNVTYEGNHAISQFRLSTGETSQLLLSQPVIQGDNGIWCVERWMDGNGTVYNVTPETDIMIADYYKELQKQSDDGIRTSLLDPMKVATDFIKNNLGQHVFVNELILRHAAKAEDFYKTPESHFIGYISNFKIENASFHLDKIEWLTLDDTERLRELNIGPNDMPNGFYIYNPNSYPMHFLVTDKTEYSIINWSEGITHKTVTMEEFRKYLEQYSDLTPPFRVVTKDGYVQSITEQYMP